MNASILSLWLLALTSTSAARASTRPNILLVLADDLGWANVGWHRPGNGSFKEVQTPNMNALVREEGIELNRAYAYHMCSPTRSSLQSGRLPMHVNVVNSNPTIYNASESSGTGAGIPRNMTTVATKLRDAGYKTVMAGKWDAGMATPTHTPNGRGYQSAIGYFHHGNSYWTEETGDLTCDVAVDLYDTHGPAWGINGTKGSEPSYNDSNYEEHVFRERLLGELEAYDSSKDGPLFMFYPAHLVHDPYEVPQNYLDHMSKQGGGPFDNGTSAKGDMRFVYAAMVKYLDDNVGAIVNAWKAKDGGALWQNTLMLFFSDNGGPIYAGGNNDPLRGGKYSEFEGGVRVSAFASGGLIPESKRGKVSDGIISVADVYSTLCALAGVDPFDKKGEAAGLPPVDGLDLSAMLVDPAVDVSASPRTVLPLMPLQPKYLLAEEQYRVWLAQWNNRSDVGATMSEDWDVHMNATCSNGEKDKVGFVSHCPSISACEGNCSANAKCQSFEYEVEPGKKGNHWCSLYGTAMAPHPTKDDKYACVCKGKCPTSPGPGPGPGTKLPTCWKIGSCNFEDDDIKVIKNVDVNDCCTLCEDYKSKDGVNCTASTWTKNNKTASHNDGNGLAYAAARSIKELEAKLDERLANTARAQHSYSAGDGGGDLGTCRLKKTMKKQTVEKDSVCYSLSRDYPPPVPIIDQQGGIVMGDLKLITGTAVSMTMWTGPQYPNASTPADIPKYACTTPYRRACLFNVTADPTEHNELSAQRPDDAKMLLEALLNSSKSFFNPKRGDGDQRACKQMEGPNRGFYGPWLELND